MSDKQKDYKPYVKPVIKYDFLMIPFKLQVDMIKVNEYGKDGWYITSVIYKQYNDTYEVYLTRQL